MADTEVKHTQCSDCNTNPSLNDDSRGIKWIQGNVVKAEPCGCTIEGRGFCNYPIHIHYCDTHKAAPDMLAALKAAQEEIRLIRMKDCNVVYNPCLQLMMSLAIAKAGRAA